MPIALSRPVPTELLDTGSRMPLVGLGLRRVAPGDCADTVVRAIRACYPHLGSACDCGNEREVGEGIRCALGEGRCTREELWITSKLRVTAFSPLGALSHVELDMAERDEAAFGTFHPLYE